MTTTTWNLHELLATMATQAGKNALGDKEEKYFVVSPLQTAVDEAVYRDEKAAHGDSKVGKTHYVVGPITAVRDIGNNKGWYRHPAGGFVLVTDTMISVGIRPDSKDDLPARLLEYPLDEYDAFLIITPKRKSA